MGRRRIIAGNWKMHTRLDEAVALARGVVAAADGSEADVVVIPPACFLGPVIAVTEGSAVRVGAQNLHPEPKGAFTGEIAGEMLASLGCAYVICGHSERRHVFGEGSELVGAKVAAALRAGLTPILCVGETLADREADRTEAVVSEQLAGGLGSLDADAVASVVVAYEPVWAIGTGRTATPAQAQAVHAHVRADLAARIGDAAAQRSRVQYGGSVKPANAAEILAQPDVDGALVGGASLDAEAFAAIVRA